jgi:hypothetical protein
MVKVEMVYLHMMHLALQLELEKMFQELIGLQAAAGQVEIHVQFLDLVEMAAAEMVGLHQIKLVIQGW